MAVILTHVLSCCLSRKPSKSRIQDEESNLIPPNAEITSFYSPSPDLLLNLPTLRERMLDIVQTKESKMINVVARRPFYFQSRPDVSTTSEDAAALSPTYSRSVSASSLPQDRLYSRPFLPQSPIYASQFFINQTLSRNSSVIFLNGSSTTDIFLENQDDERSASRARTSRSPILNIRFVRGPSSHLHAGNVTGISRGRPRKKANPENLQPAEPVDLLSHIPPPQETQNVSHTQSPLNYQTCLTNVESDTTAEEAAEPVLSISPPSTTDFELSDPLVIGWED